MTSRKQLDLQAAADELGVHYQTAYRWVRTGQLRADMVGGRYLVRQDDLAALRESRAEPTAPRAPRSVRIERSAERLHAALLAGDEPAARRITCRLVDEGAPLIDVVQEVLVPPLRRIGQAWHDGELTIWAEHRASAIVERILGELAPNPRGRRRGTALVAAVRGDRHSLPTTMAAVALRDDNWHVHHLGADLPPAELVEFCADHDVDLAVISVTDGQSARLAASTAADLRNGGTPTVLGGPGRSLRELLEEARSASAAAST